MPVICVDAKWDLTKALRLFLRESSYGFLEKDIKS